MGVGMGCEGFVGCLFAPFNFFLCHAHASTDDALPLLFLAFPCFFLGREGEELGRAVPPIVTVCHVCVMPREKKAPGIYTHF